MNEEVNDRMHSSTFSKNSTLSLIDLISEKFGGKALACSDEWFAECSNLVRNTDPVFKEGYFVDTGQWMDGWESRRSYRRSFRINGPDHDWCVLRLGCPGRIRRVDVDTRHFRGNAPECISLEAAAVEGDPTRDTSWTELLSRTTVNPDAHNEFDLEDMGVWTHLRLKIYPDGGVARLRAYGEVVGRRQDYIEGEIIDLAGAINGGRGLDCSDMFYSSPNNLLMPDKGVNMGDGWETKRRRDESNDWCIIKLGVPGCIQKVILDTAHFKGNFPDSFSLEAAFSESDDLTNTKIKWKTVLPQTKLHADRAHIFIDEINVPSTDEFTHVRLNIFPDGGVSRLRVYGTPQWRD